MSANRTWRNLRRMNDKTFLTDVLPHFDYSEFDVGEAAANIRWFVDGVAVQLNVCWNDGVIILDSMPTSGKTHVGATHVAIVAVPTDLRKPIQDDTGWRLKTNAEGQSRWRWYRSITGEMRISHDHLQPVPDPVKYTCGGPVHDGRDHRIAASFDTVGLACSVIPADYQAQISLLVRKILASFCGLGPLGTMPHFPPPPYLSKLSFADMKIHLNGLFKRPVA